VNDVRFVPPLAVGSVPVTPVVKGKPVALVNVALVGVPRIGVTSVGLVAKTLAPLPVSSVKAAARFALDGVARKVATPVPKPDTPVEIGRPVAFVSVTDAGVFRIAPAPNVATPVTPKVLDADRVVNAPAAAVDVPTGPLNESPTAPV
jgi:hypothetical protein